MKEIKVTLYNFEELSGELRRAAVKFYKRYFLNDKFEYRCICEAQSNGVEILSLGYFYGRTCGRFWDHPSNVLLKIVKSGLVSESEYKYIDFKNRYSELSQLKKKMYELMSVGDEGGVSRLRAEYEVGYKEWELGLLDFVLGKLDLLFIRIFDEMNSDVYIKHFFKLYGFSEDGKVYFKHSENRCYCVGGLE